MARVEMWLRSFSKNAGPYLSVSGRITFPVLLVMMLSGIWVESFRPGLVFNQLSPQILVMLLLLSGALSLFSGEERKLDSLHRILFAVAGSAAVLVVWCLSSAYFASLGTLDRFWLTVAAAGIVLLVVSSALSAGLSADTKTNKEN